MVLFIPFMAAPHAMIFYVKNEIRSGNWGDFSVEPPKIADDEDEEEDFNDAFVDIEKDFEDEDKDDTEETPTDAKNSTVSEEAKSESEKSEETKTENADKSEEHVNEDL
jgi:hypothetical protein